MDLIRIIDHSQKCCMDPNRIIDQAQNFCLDPNRIIDQAQKCFSGPNRIIDQAQKNPGSPIEFACRKKSTLKNTDSKHRTYLFKTVRMRPAMPLTLKQNCMNPIDDVVHPQTKLHDPDRRYRPPSNKTA